MSINRVPVHPVYEKSVEIFWAEIYWGRHFLGPNLVSFNRAVVPLFELSFLHILTNKKKLDAL
jgi:hypothetical protein